jgi:hypothetical protein
LRVRVRELGDEDVRTLERAGFKTAIQLNSVAPSQTAASSIVLKTDGHRRAYCGRVQKG